MNHLNEETSPQENMEAPTPQTDEATFPSDEAASETNTNLPNKAKNKVKISLVWKILVPITLIFTGVIVYMALTTDILHNLTNGNDEPPETPVVVKPDPVNPIKTVENSYFKISFQYNSDEHDYSQREAFSDQPAYFRITGTNSRPETITSEAMLEDGYMVKISAFEDIERDIEDLAQRKIEKFKLECPTQAEIGKVYTRQIDGIDAASFEVRNCNQDFLLNFTAFDRFIFEIAQVYRGDIGFRQAYKAETEEIVRSIKWLRILQEKPETTFLENGEYEIRIEHPWLDTECCTVTTPAIEGLVKIAVFGQLEETNETSSETDNKFGVFVAPRNKRGFELFVNEQKQALIQEYTVVEGERPSNLEESIVNVGSLTGVRLENYAWWGTVTYVDYARKDVFIIIVTPREISASFSQLADEIMETALIGFGE